MSAVAEKTKTKKFLLKQGKHHEANPSGDGVITYRPGDVIVTTKDMVKSFGAEKFERLSDDAHVPAPGEGAKERMKQQQDDALDDMTIEELRSFAEGEEIDLMGAKKKDDIVAAIRLARNSVE